MMDIRRAINDPKVFVRLSDDLIDLMKAFS
jgi:hypothetical protein